MGRSSPQSATDRSDDVKSASLLARFLHDERRSKSREYLLTSRVIHDLMTAAGARNYDLLVYTPTVDSDGFDIILDDRDSLIPLQLKSVVSDGRTKKWRIHRRLLRPERHETESFGFDSDPCGDGRGGGVLLVEVLPRENTTDLAYCYTDVRVLTAFWLGVIKVNPATKRRLERLRLELTAHPSGSVWVPRTAFVRARSAEHLLSIIGLNSRLNTEWPYLLEKLARSTFKREQLGAPEQTVRDLLCRAIEHLTG